MKKSIEHLITFGDLRSRLHGLHQAAKPLRSNNSKSAIIQSMISSNTRDILNPETVDYFFSMYPKPTTLPFQFEPIYTHSVRLKDALKLSEEIGSRNFFHNVDSLIVSIDGTSISYLNTLIDEPELFPNLESMILFVAPNGDEFLGQLLKYPNFESLEKLHVDRFYNRTSEELSIVLQHSYLPDLQHLSLSSCYHGRKHKDVSKVLSNSGFSPTLDAVSLVNFPKPLKFLLKMQKEGMLNAVSSSSLSKNNNLFTVTNTPRFFSLRLPFLEHLDLSETNLSDTSLKLILKMPFTQDLKSLLIQRTNVTVEGIQHIFESQKPASLEWLDIDFTKLDAKTTELISESNFSKQLTHLTSYPYSNDHPFVQHFRKSENTQHLFPVINCKKSRTFKRIRRIYY